MSHFDRLRHKFAAHTASGRAPPGVIIDVADVTPAKTPLREVDYGAAVDTLLARSVMPAFLRTVVFGEAAGAAGSRPVEACAHCDGRLVANVQWHPFVAAVHLAFDEHRPLVLSPDMLWLLVAQGFANHVNANAEALRPQFVAHPGKETINVRRDDFVKGSPANPRPQVFEEFSGGIREHIGAATHDLLLPRFSTTGPTEKAAAEVVLMDAMQAFFDFQLHTLCGIPQIVLEGTHHDWQLLAERTRALG